MLYHAVPEPTSIVVNSSKSNPIQPVGSDVTLTCVSTVDLSPSVDVPTILNIVLTGPLGSVDETMQPVTRMTSTYNSTVTINSFGSDQSGNYSCFASITLMNSSKSMYIIDSNNIISEMVFVTVGKQLFNS